MPRRRQDRPPNPDQYQGAGRYLAERLVAADISMAEFARRLGKTGTKDVAQWFGSANRPPARPAWDSLEAIRRALDLPPSAFDALRMALGYRGPDESEPEPIDEWELETLRLARQLFNLLRRAPPETRQGIRFAVTATLNALALELERLGAQSDEPLP